MVTASPMDGFLLEAAATVDVRKARALIEERQLVRVASLENILL